MEVMDNVLFKLNVPTKEISSKVIQDIMLIIKKSSIPSKELEGKYKEYLEILWNHLTSELLEFDDQLLCCTCFFFVLGYSEEKYIYLHKASQILNHEVMLKKENNKGESKVYLAVSLCYGIFQSTFLQKIQNAPVIVKSILQGTFQLLTLMAYEYSQYTFIVFKIMTAFKKIIGTQYEQFLFNDENNIRLLNLINHNWENPITGVRNSNSILFHTILLVLHNDMTENVLNEINSFYWNKAKFLMLTEFIEYLNYEIEELMLKNKWIDGLMYSLNEPGLVSAGADMYYSILKKINSEESWLNIFLVNIIQILVGTSYKAIENFTNYWCLATFKKFPALIETIIFELQKCNITESDMYSTFCILKQGNKLGLMEKLWIDSHYSEKEKLVLRALEHSNAAVRMLAFEIICINQGKHLPPKIVFQEVLQFVRNNVNSDCTVLRLSMLNTLSDFLITLHTLFINNFPNQTHSLEELQIFCEKLQTFIIDSLNLDGNYQRKITTVKIAYLVLNHFDNVPRKKQKQMRSSNTSLLGYLKTTENWFMNTQNFIMKLITILKDPSSDVHNNVLEILLNFYLTDLSDTDTLNYLIQESLTCIQSKFFFEISCGLNILKLIISIIIENKIVEAKFKTIEDIFYFAYNEIILEYGIKRNIVESVTQGKQIHSFLSVLDVIYNSSLKFSYRMTVSNEIICKLLDIVKNISKQFAWEGCDKSSDFSEINDMVLHIINTSGLESECKDDQTNNSGIYQIVLNSLWLNVKASCEIASTMLQYYGQNMTISEECLEIIGHVLETSRHKGAIEAAGAALGQGIRYLTSLETKSDVSKLPFTFLKTKLNELLLETNVRASVTRRGAGLSIMVHKIVSNDCQKGKPLFHFFMKTILNTCNNLQTPYNCDELNKDDEKDIPKAIYIHFLTKIVTDSNLTSDIMYYSAELAELAFSGLANAHWQIRNAALQLYGALIPKLIGQKKASGEDDLTVSSVACDEFRTHSPKLWDYIVKQIKNNDNQDIVQRHSNLVPILNLLASIAKRYNFSFDLQEQMSFDFVLLTNLITLFDSPIYTVRRLASKAITNLFTFETILDTVRKRNIISENYLNGILMVIERCYKFYSHDHMQKKQLDNLRDQLRQIIYNGNHSHFCKWNLEKMVNEENPDITIETFEKLLETEKKYKHEPGASLLINTKIQKFLKIVAMNSLPHALTLLRSSYEFEGYCKLILHRIKITKEHSNELLLEIVRILLSSDLRMNSSILWEAIYNISLKINLQMLDTSYLHEYLKHDISYKLRYIVPYAARLFLEHNDNKNLFIVSRKVYLLCNPEYYDVDMRYIAAVANNELSSNFKNLTEDVKINTLMSAVILLQDENEDVRNLSVTFHTNVFDNLKSKHPYICLNEILNKEFLYSILDQPLQSLQRICEDLLTFINSLNSSQVHNFNPFNHDSKNIYLEFKRIRQMLTDLN